MGKKFCRMKSKYLILWLLAVVLFYVLNAISPALRDDFTYQFMYKAPGYNFDYNHPIKTFGDVIQSQIPHYFNWGGRAIVHVFAQLFCGILGKGLYNIVAALMFGVWMLPFGKLCFPSIPKAYSGPMSMFATFVFWIYMGEPMVFYNGLTFGLNYLYTSMLCLLFVYVFLNYKREENQGLIKYLLPVLAFFAAWGHEAFTVGVGTLLSIWCITHLKRISKTQIVSFGIFCVGAAFLIFAPGNFARSGGVQSSIFASLQELLISYKFFLCILLIILVYWNKWTLLYEACLKNIHFVGAWIVSVLFVAVIGQISTRALVGVDLFGFMLLVRLLCYNFHSTQIYHLSPFLSLGLLGLLACIIYYQKPASDEYARFYETCSKAKTGSDVYFTFKHLSTPKWMVDKFVGYRYHWCSVFWDKEYAKAYNLKLHISEEDATDFQKLGSKVLGKNTFYRMGNYLYSSVKLPSSINVKVHYGNYKADNVLFLFKKVVALTILPDKRSQISEQKYSVQTMELSPDKTVYRIFVGNDNTGREINSVDIL